MPIPVLIILSFVGLCIYVAIGAAVSAVFIHHMATEATVKNYLNKRGAEDALAGYVFGTIFWPFLILATVFILPIGIGTKITRYIAAAQLKEEIPNAA